MTADRLRQLAAEAGFEQIMKHKDGSTTVLPDALFERFAALVLQDNQAPAEGDELPPLPAAKRFYYADDDRRTVRKPLDLFTADQMRDYARAANVQPKGTDAGSWVNADDIDALTKRLDSVLNGPRGAEAPKLCDIVAQLEDDRVEVIDRRDLFGLVRGAYFEGGNTDDADTAEVHAQAYHYAEKTLGKLYATKAVPSPAPAQGPMTDAEISAETLARYGGDLKRAMGFAAGVRFAEARGAVQAPAVADGAEAWGYINERGEPVKFADAQQHKRDESYLRMAGLPVLYAVASKPPVQGTGDANG